MVTVLSTVIVVPSALIASDLVDLVVRPDSARSGAIDRDALADVAKPSAVQLPPSVRVMEWPAVNESPVICVPISAIVPTSTLMRAVSTAPCAVGINCWTAASVSVVA